MEQLSIPHFRELLSYNISNLENRCKEWEKQQTNSSVPEEVIDEIRTTIGLTNLLLSQKIKQFKGLIDDCEFKRGEKEITCLDLQGFWDMVYNEVYKIEKRFEKLANCKSNEWVFVEEASLNVQCKKKMFPAVAKAIIPAKNHASAARQRLAEAKKKMKSHMNGDVDKTQQMAKMVVPEQTSSKENHASAARQRLAEAKRKMAAQMKGDAARTEQEAKVVICKDSPTKKQKKHSNIILDEPDELKSAISNITNMYISEHNNATSSSPKKLTSRKNSHAKVRESVDKENIIISQTFDSKSKTQKEKKVKEFIPLQCVTRSVKKAMMVKQN